MSTERWIRLIAGLMTLLSVALTVVVNRHWIWFTVFIGANLVQSSLTDWCFMKSLFERTKTRLNP